MLAINLCKLTSHKSICEYVCCNQFVNGSIQNTTVATCSLRTYVRTSVRTYVVNHHLKITTYLVYLRMYVHIPLRFHISFMVSVLYGALLLLMFLGLDSCTHHQCIRMYVRTCACIDIFVNM